MVRIDRRHLNQIHNNNNNYINPPIRIRSNNIAEDNRNLISYRNELREYNLICNSNLNIIRNNISQEYISEIEPNVIDSWMEPIVIDSWMEPNVIDSWMEPPLNPPILLCVENSTLPSYEDILPPPMYVKKLPKLPKLPAYSPPTLTQSEIDEIKRLKILADKEKERQKILADKEKERQKKLKKKKRNTELFLDKNSIQTHWDGFGKFCDSCLGGMIFTGGLSLFFIPIGLIFCGGYYCGKYIKYKIKKNIYKLL
jgi:hypothetical protein